MQVENGAQAALTAARVPRELSLAQRQHQTSDAEPARSGMPDMVAFSRRAKEVLEEIRRQAAEAGSAGHGQSPGSDAAALSLRLDTSGPARLSGAVSGSARVGLQDVGTGSGGNVDLDVATGDGDDKVSISKVGQVASNAVVLTNGGDDTIGIKGGVNGVVSAGNGNDLIEVEGAIDKVVGGAGDDTINVKNSPGLISGGDGNDRINISWDASAGSAKRRYVELLSSNGKNAQVAVKENVTEVSFRRGGGHDEVTTSNMSEGRASGAADIWMYDLSASDVGVEIAGKDLTLRVKDTGDTMILKNYQEKIGK